MNMWLVAWFVGCVLCVLGWFWCMQVFVGTSVGAYYCCVSCFSFDEGNVCVLVFIACCCTRLFHFGRYVVTFYVFDVWLLLAPTRLLYLLRLLRRALQSLACFAYFAELCLLALLALQSFPEVYLR